MLSSNPNDPSFIRRILESEKSKIIDSDKDLEDAYHNAVRDAHTQRSEIITNILGNYDQEQEKRFEYKRNKKAIIFWVFMSLMIILALQFVVCSVLIFVVHKTISNQDIIAVISNGVTFLTAVISIFLIIVKYIFPTDEEKYFNELVKAIVESDTIQIKNEIDYFAKKNKLEQEQDENLSKSRTKLNKK